MSNKKERRTEFFNERAAGWDEYAKHDPEKVRYILDKLSIKPGHKVLDVGCGTGILTTFITDLIGDTGNLKSIDISKEMIKIAKSKFSMENVEFVCDDIATINIPENHFDAVVFYSVFPHIDEKEDVIRRCTGFLKHGGKLSVAHSQSRKDIMAIHSRGDDSPVSNDYFPEMTEIEKMFTDSGLSVIFNRDDSQIFIITGEK